MSRTTAFLATMALVFGGAAWAQSRTMDNGEVQLERMVDGRVAGTAVDCIPTPDNIDRMTVIAHVGLVYDADETLYVARVSDPDKLRRLDRIEFIRASNKELCVTDKALTVDRASSLQTGMVHLEGFVPFTRRD